MLLSLQYKAPNSKPNLSGDFLPYSPSRKDLFYSNRTAAHNYLLQIGPFLLRKAGGEGNHAILVLIALPSGLTLYYCTMYTVHCGISDRIP